MRVDPLPSVLSQPDTEPAEGPPAPRDEFLRLFVAQLEHQDPLEPQSGAEFVAQLAQFATLEQSAEANSRLSQIAAEQAAASRISMAGLVGRTVEARAEAFRVDGSGPLPEVRLDLDGPATEVEVVIVDESGREVASRRLGPQAAGEHGVLFDGPPLEEGNYKIEIRAKGQGGTTPSAHAHFVGTIDSIEFVDGVASFRVGAIVITPSDIESVQS